MITIEKLEALHVHSNNNLLHKRFKILKLSEHQGWIDKDKIITVAEVDSEDYLRFSQEGQSTMFYLEDGAKLVPIRDKISLKRLYTKF